MKNLLFIAILFIVSCEKVVIIQLPPEQNLLVIEGFISDVEEEQKIRLTRSNSFLGPQVVAIENAVVTVDIRNQNTLTFTHSSNGYYNSPAPFAGLRGQEYRTTIVLEEGELIRSDWSKMSVRAEIELLSSDDFEENDLDNPSQTKTIYFPRVTARDSADVENYYRWVLHRNGTRMTTPESITLQSDRFFDGNFIPNLFDQFEYAAGDEMKVELVSIEKDLFDYLSLLKSQITTFGGAASTTPASVEGNIRNLSNPNETVLGYFGTIAISADSIAAE